MTQIKTTWRGPKPNAFTIPSESTVLKSIRVKHPNYKHGTTEIALPGSTPQNKPGMMKPPAKR